MLPVCQCLASVLYALPNSSRGSDYYYSLPDAAIALADAQLNKQKAVMGLEVGE
jgi:hypothetical protein